MRRGTAVRVVHNVFSAPTAMNFASSILQNSVLPVVHVGGALGGFFQSRRLVAAW